MIDAAVNIIADAILRFHFLRPEWLLLILAPIALFFLQGSSQAPLSWSRHIHPDLLPHLLLQPKLQQRHSLGLHRLLLSVVLVLAMAGPTWQLSPKRLNQGQQKIIVVLKLDASMTLQTPRGSRLDLAKIKLLDFIQGHPSAAIGLWVYAGSAHRVLPPSQDHSVLTKYLSELTPELMPKPGNNPLAVLNSIELNSLKLNALELGLLDSTSAENNTARLNAGGSTSILFLTDADEPPTLEINTNLVVGSRVVIVADSRAMASPNFFSRHGFKVLSMTEGDADVAEAGRLFSQAWSKAQSAEDDWLDRGQSLVWLLLLLLLPWFRKGRVLW